MASARACGRAPAAPSSSGGAPRAVSASLPDGRPYDSLRKASEIGKVRRIGSRRRAGGVLVFTAPGPADRPRVAVVAGRRVGSSVRRNRAKRRLREALVRAPLRTGRDYVVIADETVAEAPFEDVVVWLVTAMEGEE